MMVADVLCYAPSAASSSEETLISKASLEGLPAASAAVGGMRRFFDISVPRNISADVNQLDGDAHVYNVDDLKEVRACCGHRPLQLLQAKGPSAGPGHERACL